MSSWDPKTRKDEVDSMTDLCNVRLITSMVSERRGQVEEVEGPKEAAAVIGEEVCKAVDVEKEKAVGVEKEKVVDVEKDQSESQMGNHWRKRLVGLC